MAFPFEISATDGAARTGLPCLAVCDDRTEWRSLSTG